MELTLDRIFLDCSVRCLNELASRVDDCLCRLDGSQVWFRGGESQNAVGNLVLHLAGNVRQWVVSGVSGAPDVRDRDAEFAARIADDDLARDDAGSAGDRVGVIRIGGSHIPDRRAGFSIDGE